MGLKVGISGETWMLELLKRVLPKQQGVFVDVGVNLGQTLIKVKSADPARKYLGFEPNPLCISYVSKLIEANSFTDCRVIPAGLYPESQILQLNFYQDNADDSSAPMIEELRPSCDIKQRIYVPVTDFAAVASQLEIEKIGVIKVDVEGAELEVFQTLRKAIEMHQLIIIVEILPIVNDVHNVQLHRQQQIEDIFSALDYQFYRILKRPKSRFAGLDKISTIGVQTDLHHRDYLIVPAKDSRRIEQQLRA